MEKKLGDVAKILFLLSSVFYLIWIFTTPPEEDKEDKKRLGLINASQGFLYFLNRKK